jgi:DNA-binding FadR family transcriptional regulator
MGGDILRVHQARGVVGQSEDMKNEKRLRSGRSSVVRVPKTAELVASELRRRIIRGELKEGDNLPPESSLIEEFGISRPTMREAFRILETEQLISVSRGSRGGARVHLPEIEVVARYAGLYLQARNTKLADIYEARLLIEPAAVALIAKRRPKQVLAELRELLAEAKAHIEDPEAYSHHIVQFHLRVVEASGNETLMLIAQVIHTILEASLLSATKARYVIDWAKRGLRSEEKLLSLLEAGDEKAAEIHWRHHLRIGSEVILKHQGSRSIVEVLSWASSGPSCSPAFTPSAGHRDCARRGLDTTLRAPAG